jgi:ribosomal protein L31
MLALNEQRDRERDFRLGADCVDSATWHQKDHSGWRCNYVAKNNRAKRCHYHGADGTTAFESCPQTCGSCSAARDSQTTTKPTTMAVSVSFQNSPVYHNHYTTFNSIGTVTKHPSQFVAKTATLKEYYKAMQNFVLTIQ